MRAPGIVILAAGGSSRMGTPKQLLSWNGRSLLRYMAEKALQTACRPVIVVLGANAESCRAECTDLPLRAIVNENWPAGLGSSISVGVAALQREDPSASGVLFLLVDQPAVTSTWLDLLVAEWSPPDWPIVAADYDGRAGVPAVFDRSYFSALRALPPGEGARSVLAEEAERVRRLPPERPLFDLDTPENYRHYRALETQRRT